MDANYDVEYSFESIYSRSATFSVCPKYGAFGNLPSRAHYTPPSPSTHANNFNSRPAESYVRPNSRLVSISDANLQRDGPDEECYLDIDRKIYMRYASM